ncbi:MAG: metal transporter [Acidobacteria bacterium]|nr:metal transporter [Acidobacteriota bacterium]
MSPKTGAVSRTNPMGVPLWAVGLLPLVLLAALIAAIVWWDPARSLQSPGVPPVEKITFQRVVLNDGGIAVTVLNDGPDPVTIAQVQVDEAYWSFESDAGRRLRHLERTTLKIPYPWVAGESHTIRVLTSTGVAFDRTIPVAVETPRPDARFFGIFSLIGLYVGVLPIAIGLLWYPLVARLGRTGFDFVLALTIGLLVFLLVDGTHEGLESADAVPGSFQGTALFGIGVIGAYLSIETLGAWLRERKTRAKASAVSGGFILALLVAIGIGLHNFGEGLAIGAAFGLGEATLGTLLIVGFTLHNTTEGLAIVAPLVPRSPDAEREDTARPRIIDLVKLGVIGGAPTIAGAWLGGFVYSPIWSVAFLAVGVGAIAQVVVQISRQMASGRPVMRYFASGPVLAGLVAGFGVMYVTGMMIG